MSLSSAGTLIPADNNFAVLAALFAMIVAGVAAEKTTFGKRISGAMVVIILSVVLANLRVIPTTSPVFAVIWVYLVPLAIALFLIRADLVSIVRNGGRVLIAFLFGALGAAAGSLMGPLLLDLGPYEEEYAAIFSATFIGGALNFAAVSEAVGFRNPTELAAALAIDSVLSLGYFLLLSSLAVWARFQAMFSYRLADLQTPPTADVEDSRAPTLQDISVSLGLAATACAVGTAIASWADQDSYTILFITAIMILVATLARKQLQTIRGPELVATIFMYLFFALLGAGADIRSMLDAAPALFLFVLLIFAVHVVFMLAGAWLCRLNFAEIIIASSACIGGPPIAVAFAVLFRWQNLATPGVVTGIFGYAIGNFIGVGMHRLLS